MKTLPSVHMLVEVWSEGGQMTFRHNLCAKIAPKLPNLYAHNISCASSCKQACLKLQNSQTKTEMVPCFEPLPAAATAPE